MRRIDCQSTRLEVEAAEPGEFLSSTATDHLRTCKECWTFRDEDWKLRKLVASLGTVNAPGDFDFRLRARLANGKHGMTQSIAGRKLSFSFRAAAFGSVLLFGAALMFAILRMPSNDSRVARQTAPAAVGTESSTITKPRLEALQNSASDKDKNVVPDLPVGPQTNSPVEVKLSSSALPNQHRSRSRLGFRPGEFASARDAGRVRSRDLASTPAKVFRSTNSGPEPLSSNAFPIGASYQPLKVSLDDGRGTSRTISLPSVSFGSQRVLTQGATPVFAKARGSW